ncbi:TNF receptor-associated factor 2 [Pteropus vampyrus]|uniref:TNF receptor-associated factor n=1 Tax=Pteropus vampyrus TaxID=132908 RepID=A0A6P3QSL4_PTEVA|nr:TNF receptor-associated factor 2 [Pteropus vampyrus]
MAAASVTPPSSLDVLQPGFSKTVLGTKLEDKYLCSACKNVLRRPFQAQCGHRYCSFCLSSILSSGPQNCAACVHEGIYEDGVSILESSSAFPDNAARREVESLPAVCPNHGCTWKGTLKEYESYHEGHCPFMLTECPACKGLVRLSERDRHAERECPERSLSCQHCGAPCCRASVEAHHEVCPRFPVTCDDCGSRIPREDFQGHRGIASLSGHLLPDPTWPWGPRDGGAQVAVGEPPCLILQVESEKQPEHEAQRLREHLAMLLAVLLEAGALGSGPQLCQAAELVRRCEALERKTATFENIVCVLNREVERVAMTAEACGRQHRLDQDRIEALSNKVQQLERSIGLKDLALADLEQKVRDMEAATFDGVLIWKIPGFARKRQEAVAGRTPAIFSPGTGLRHAPKLLPYWCPRAATQWGAVGSRGHAGLGLSVAHSWALPSQVTLMLLDQNNREHVIDAFRPDVTSSSFQRPVTDMNIASGCPLFCPVSKMEAKNSYVRDDAIFIKAIVDLTGL